MCKLLYLCLMAYLWSVFLVNLTFFTMLFLKFLLLLLVAFALGLQKECTMEEKNECTNTNGNSHKYTKDSNRKFANYLKSFEEAQAQYIPCNNTNCGCYSSVINQDLKPFQEGITQAMIDDVKAKGTKYQVIDNHLYRDSNCLFPARCAGIEHFLLKLLPQLPNLELIVNTRDWPQMPKYQKAAGPVFSFSKTKDYYDIMYPTWAFWEGGPAIGLYPTGIGRWDTHRNKIGKVGNETSWEDKQRKAFFRGSRTNSERDNLILLSRESSDLVDAQYTKNQAWKSEADTLHAAPAKEVSFTDHCQYRYLFNFRGVAASFRFKHILLCKSTVFHVGNEWLEFFYPVLKPWIHYIPVETNAKKEEIKNLIEFAVNYDHYAKLIAEEGYNTIWNKLKMKDAYCYWRKLLNKYAQLLTFTPELDSALIEITK